MAANLIQDQFGTPVVWADTTDFSGTANGFTRTAQIDLTSVAAGGAREGAKVDLGANAAPRYVVRVGLEFAVAPTAGEIVQIGFSWSQSATAGTGNDAGAAGADGAYKASSEAEWFAQLLDWVNFVVTADATTVVQYATCGVITPQSRYVSPIVYNAADQALVSDAVEQFVALIPITPEVE